MRLNLGCGRDIRPGYENVDFRNVERPVDLSKLPWPYADGSAEEILMLDFLEHFSYTKTEAILQEAWRVLRLGATIDIQVPDFEQCARAVINERTYVCNRCGYEFRRDFTPRTEIEGCPLCRQTHAKIAEEAIHRLYGGQDYEGNWHYNAFTKETLRYVLEKNGFGSIVELEKNQNGETFRQNWNVKLRATKIENMWGNDD